MTGPRGVKFVTSLACTNPDCGAMFEVHAAGIDHGVAICGFCGCSLMDISNAAQPSGVPDADEGEGTQVIVTWRPRTSGS